MFSLYAMKRYMTTFAWLSLSLTLAAGAETHIEIRRPARQTAGLLGPVKSVTMETSYSISDGNTRVLTVYDRAGNLVSETEWDQEGELVNTATNYYNQAGCYVSRCYTEFGEDGSTSNWDVILSPETRQIGMKNSSTGFAAVRTYGPQRQLLTYRLTDGDKKLIRASQNKWNAESTQRTQYIRFDEKKRPLYTYYFKWKDNGFIDMERLRYHQDQRDRLHDFEYPAADDQGNWTQQMMVRYDITGRQKKKVYERTTRRTIEYHATNPAGDLP